MSNDPENRRSAAPPSDQARKRLLRNISVRPDPFLLTKLPLEGTVRNGAISIGDGSRFGFVRGDPFPDGTRVRITYDEWLFAVEIDDARADGAPGEAPPGSVPPGGAASPGDHAPQATTGDRSARANPAPTDPDPAVPEPEHPDGSAPTGPETSAPVPPHEQAGPDARPDQAAADPGGGTAGAAPRPVDREAREREHAMPSDLREEDPDESWEDAFRSGRRSDDA